MKRLVIAIAILALAVPVAVSAQPEPERIPKAQGVKIGGVPEGVGTIQYDPGAPADSFVGQTGPSVTIGNRFSSRNGQPLSPGSVSAFSFYPQNFPGGLVGFWGPPTGGGGAPFFGSIYVSGVASNTFNVFAITPNNFGTDFMVGIYIPTSGQIGMRSASTANQGFHAMQISWNGGSGGNYQSIASNNAMFRVSGSIIVPVELMEFDLD